MALVQTKVNRSLDKKLLIAGYEIPEVLCIFSLLAVLNFLFGSSHYALFVVWLPPVIVAAILRIGKKDRPENFLLHYFRSKFEPGHYTAFNPD